MHNTTSAVIVIINASRKELDRYTERKGKLNAKGYAGMCLAKCNFIKRKYATPTMIYNTKDDKVEFFRL